MASDREKGSNDNVVPIERARLITDAKEQNGDDSSWRPLPDGYIWYLSKVLRDPVLSQYSVASSSVILTALVLWSHRLWKQPDPKRLMTSPVSESDIVAFSGISKRHVQRCLQTLVAAGVIERVSYVRNGWVYRILSCSQIQGLSEHAKDEKGNGRSVDMVSGNGRSVDMVSGNGRSVDTMSTVEVTPCLLNEACSVDTMSTVEVTPCLLNKTCSVDTMSAEHPFFPNDSAGLEPSQMMMEIRNDEIRNGDDDDESLHHHHSPPTLQGLNQGPLLTPPDSQEPKQEGLCRVPESATDLQLQVIDLNSGAPIPAHQAVAWVTSATRMARAIRGLDQTCRVNPSLENRWYGSLPPSDKEIQTLANGVHDAGVQDLDTFFGLCPTLTRSVSSFASLAACSALYGALESALDHSSISALPGLLERLAMALPRGSGRPAAPGTQEVVELCAWLLDAAPILDEFGWDAYWTSRYEYWADRGEERLKAGKAVAPPSIWDLLRFAPLPDMRHKRADANSLRGFLGLSEQVKILTVAAGFKLNPSHVALARRGKLTGTVADIESLQGLHYYAGGDYYHAGYHYAQHLALHLTEQNWPDFVALFPNEPTLRAWWDAPGHGKSPPLDVFRRFGDPGSVAQVGEDGRYGVKEVNWATKLV